MCYKKNDKGFSLIELIIVVAIMAVLVAIIAPNLTRYLKKSKYNTDLHNADELANVIQTCVTDYEAFTGHFIVTPGNTINLTWNGMIVSGGPTKFNSMVDSMVVKDPTSVETGARATASISMRGNTTDSGYKIIVNIGNATSTK